MAFASSGFDDDGLPQLSAIDQLDHLWKQGTRSRVSRSDTTSASRTGIVAGSQPTGSTMTDPNGSTPQAVDLEATPDLEVRIRVVYADNRVKNMEGSLNPTRTVQQLAARLATQLNMQPHLVEMSWSKNLNNGQQAPPKVLDHVRNLMFYEVETDDTIIIRELAEN